MIAVGLVFTVLAALLHVYIFWMESLAWDGPQARKTFGVPDAEREATRAFAFNQGFYNLFLAAGPAAGLIAHYAGYAEVGRALVLYGCAFMVGCGIVLFVSNRKLWRSMIGQSGPPLVALIATLV